MATDPILSTDPIATISATVWTAGDESRVRGNAEPDSRVFLGIAGREFRLARPDVRDFQQHDRHEYIFGNGSNVERPEWNDPRKNPPLTLGDLHNRPVYIRFVWTAAAGTTDRDDWHVERVDVTVTAASGAKVSYAALVGGPTTWLGDESGTVLHLDRQ
ncbi:hypothetical protein [Bailinhaonella thermotolerans]|uniref:PLAT domain-containing protein n=1 Tax=Bailinhaonella thermotolerans TaxID=1070861 RepID=A0A3A4BCA9_9ACTN|nr:hypothetical protein [Bailinhaonella thermotolerans]RJL35736.1 hypothetical protein D5H75_02835 [Bailinhaonella thermotolerans]